MSFIFYVCGYTECSTSVCRTLVLRLNKQTHYQTFSTGWCGIALVFFKHHHGYKIPNGTPSAVALNTWDDGSGRNVQNSTENPFISETVRDRPMVTTYH